MKLERTFWRIAFGCAALLLLAPLTPRTARISFAESESYGAGGTETQSAGWDWVVPLCGIAAMTALFVGRRQHRRYAGAITGGIVAAIGFAAAAAAAFEHWLDVNSGSLETVRWVIQPAPAAPWFAALATIGMAATLVLLGSWLHQGDVDAQR